MSWLPLPSSWPSSAVLSWLWKWFQDTVTKSEPRLMSTSPSCPLDRSLWSIQMLCAEVCTLIESSSAFRKTRLRMMTLLTLLRLSPPPLSPEPEPTPRIDLFELTLSMPDSEIMPDTRMICRLLDCSALSSADALVTVTVAPPAPPVVPPFWLAQPIGLLSAAFAVATLTATPPPATRPTASVASQTRFPLPIAKPPQDSRESRESQESQERAFLRRKLATQSRTVNVR